MKTIKNFFANETGLEMSEYAVAAALVIIAGVVLWQGLGNAIVTKITALTTAVSAGS